MLRGLCLISIALLFPFMAVAADTDRLVLGNVQILRGSFTQQRQLKGFNGPMLSEGYFIIAPKHGLIWGLEKPFAGATVITANGLVQLIDGASVMNLDAQKTPFMQHLYDTLSGILTGNWAALETDFIVTASGNAYGWGMTLMPRRADNPAMPFSSITISGQRFVETVILLKTDGDADTLNFQRQSVSAAAPTAEENRLFSACRLDEVGCMALAGAGTIGGRIFGDPGLAWLEFQDRPDGLVAERTAKSGITASQ